MFAARARRPPRALGEVSSVHNWERAGAMLATICRRLLRIPLLRYVDDLFSADRAALASSGSSAAGSRALVVPPRGSARARVRREGDPLPAGRVIHCRPKSRARGGIGNSWIARVGARRSHFGARGAGRGPNPPRRRRGCVVLAPARPQGCGRSGLRASAPPWAGACCTQARATGIARGCRPVPRRAQVPRPRWQEPCRGRRASNSTVWAGP